MTVQTSRAWFPGTYVPVARIAAVEVLPARSRRIEAAVSKGTVFHGTRAQILAAAKALMDAVAVADASDAQTAQ
jgi:hypothetical protein